MDLTLICPYEGPASGELRVVSADADKRAFEAARKKRNKYEENCKTKNMKFTPFVMYTSGKIHSDGLRFIEQLADYAAERRGILAGTLKNFYLKLLSVSLVKRLAYTINTRATACYSRNYDFRKCFRDENALINESSRVYIHQPLV